MGIPFFKNTVCLLVLSFFLFPVFGIAGVVDEVLKGDDKLAQGQIHAAEEYYATALKMAPDNWRIMRSLADVKFRLEKFAEADKLTRRILAMKVSNGNTVIATVEGEPEPFEAEIVDESVITPDSGSNNMRNYVDGKAAKPILHYRLFNMKTGKMKLIPHSQARIQYKGLPNRVREEVRELQGKITNKLIAKAGSSGPVEMVELKGGCFKMGSESGASAEKPIHEVCLKPFKMDKYEVNQSAFQTTMEHNPSRFKAADQPVESVTWHEAEEHCKKSGKRLPTEAEWEYAARGGTDTAYYWGDTFDATQSNFCDSTCSLNIRNRGLSDGFPNTAPVGSFPANPFGLHDMAGNVHEWVADWFEERYYFSSPKDNPKGPVRTNPTDRRGGGNRKVLRGGAWETSALSHRSATRKSFQTDYRIEGIGFRCAF